MFSFPKRERQFAWINDVVTPVTAPLRTVKVDIELPIYYTPESQNTAPTNFSVENECRPGGSRVAGRYPSMSISSQDSTFSLGESNCQRQTSVDKPISANNEPRSATPGRSVPEENFVYIGGEAELESTDPRKLSRASSGNGGEKSDELEGGGGTKDLANGGSQWGGFEKERESGAGGVVQGTAKARDEERKSKGSEKHENGFGIRRRGGMKKGRQGTSAKRKRANEKRSESGKGKGEGGKEKAQGGKEKKNGNQDKTSDDESRQDDVPSGNQPGMNDCHVQIDMGYDNGNVSQERCISGPSEYLKCYYNWMNYFGVCFYTIGQQNANQNLCQRTFRIIFKVIFWPVAIMAAFQTIGLTKSSIITFEPTQYNSFVLFAWFTSSTLVVAYAIYLMTCKKKKTDEMIDTMEKYEKICHSTNDSQRISWKLVLVRLLAISTISTAVTRAFLFDGIPDDIEDLLLENAHELGQNIFVWNSKTLNQTKHQLELEFVDGTHLTTKGMAFGYIVMARDIASFLEFGMIYDMNIIVGIVAFVYVMAFMKEVKAVTRNPPIENVEEWNRLQLQREAVWRKYRMLKDVMAAINELLDPLFKLMHMYNLLSYAYFMTLIIFQNTPWTSLALIAINLIKAEIGYFIAGKIAEQNDRILAWLRNWAIFTGKIRVGDVEMDINVLMNEHEKEPIGLGKGQFLIHQTFHYKFLGFVISIFFSMADDERN